MYVFPISTKGRSFFKNSNNDTRLGTQVVIFFISFQIFALLNFWRREVSIEFTFTILFLPRIFLFQYQMI